MFLLSKVIKRGSTTQNDMESEIRHRLTALEQSVRESFGRGVALAAILSLLPEVRALDKGKAQGLVKLMLEGRSGGASLELIANKAVDDVLAQADERSGQQD